jgi:signal transduction histidine kinase
LAWSGLQCLDRRQIPCLALPWLGFAVRDIQDLAGMVYNRAVIGNILSTINWCTMSAAQRIDELERQLAACDGLSPADVRRKTDLLNELAWALSDTDLQRAYALGEAGFELASSPTGGTPPYQAGLARSLRTLGYVNQRLGNHPLGLSQLLEALEICEARRLDDALPDVLDGIAGIYAQIGDFAESLSYMHRQLAAAQRIDDPRRIANAHNNLANIYLQTGDYPRTVETLLHNLQMAEETGFARMEALSLLNLADTYRLTGDYERALDYVVRGRHVSEEAGFALFEVYAHEFTGKIYLKMGNAAAAILALENALALANVLESKVIEAQILLDLAQAHLDIQCLDQALSYLQQGAAVAEAIAAKSELSTAHLLLSEVYERTGDAAQALAHFKQHQAFKELVAGEKSEQRLQVLQVAHDTETAKKEAEIARLRTVELRALNEQLEQQVAIRTAELTATVALLQKEINVREQAETEIQQLVATLEQRVAERTDELATFFDLILLAGEAADLGEVFEQVLPRIMEVTRSRALCIHLCDAEGTALHLAGQQNLTGVARTSQRTVPLEAGFQQWLQQPRDPLVTTNLAALTILPAAFRLPEFQTYLGAQIKIGSRIAGILSCYRYTDRGYGIDEIALVTALAEQLGMMLETQRLRQNAEGMAVLEERQRLARDLHDSVTQSLYSLTLFSRAGREAAEDGDTVRLNHSLTELERNTLHALREMRLLLYELRPADLEQEGLTRAIQLRLDTVERRVGLRLDVHLDELAPLPPSQEAELYHVIVEALNNVIKHAAASQLSVVLAAHDGALHLQIADDGKGFDPSQTKGGLGLRNMRERIARLHGQLVLTSAPGHGTQPAAIVPMPVEAA